MWPLLASIPSPSSGTIKLGPLTLTAYGLMIALGVGAAVSLAERRFVDRALGNAEELRSISMWAVFGGIIGARLYHVVTEWSRFSDDLGRIPLIWKGGLGIPGGLLAGVVVGLIRARQLRVPTGWLLTVVAPAIPLAQSIGRWGNWWNQELFGGATKLPWALRISAEHLPAGYAVGVFHPTFLYESLWNAALCVVLLLVDRRYRLRPGRLFGWYLIGYFVGRFWIEGLRIDKAHQFGGLRLNQWVAVAVVLAAATIFASDARSASVPVGRSDDAPVVKEPSAT